MKRILLLLAMTMACPAGAEPLSDPQRARATLLQAEQQRRVEQAREKCLAHRGPDCDSLPGLQEWLIQDRSRSDAVLDRLGGAESASTGSSSTPVRPDLPAISPRQQ